MRWRQSGKIPDLFLMEGAKPIEIGIIFAPLNKQSGADRFWQQGQWDCKHAGTLSEWPVKTKCSRQLNGNNYDYALAA